MEISQLSLKISRKINLGNLEGRSLEIGIMMNMTAGDSVEQNYHSLKKSLESQLDAWEHETRIKAAGGSFEELMAPPPLKPASESIHKPERTPKGISQTIPQTIPQYSQLAKKPFPVKNQSEQSSFRFPKCNEPMFQKGGKEYFLCTKHWGFLNQIRKGFVNDRKF